MVVTGHHDGGLQHARQVPEARQRLAVGVDVQDELTQQPLLLVGLGYGDLIEVDPVGLYVPGTRAKEQIVAPNRSDPVALLSGPRGIALPRVDDGTREVERKRRR